MNPAFERTKTSHALNCAATVIGNYDWMPLPNSYSCNKVKGNSIHTATCFLCLVQHNDSVVNSGLLDLVFANVNDSIGSTSNSSVVNLYQHHPLSVLDFKLTLYCHFTSLTLITITQLFKVLCNCNWS
jgi:hypothetical protein